MCVNPFKVVIPIKDMCELSSTWLSIQFYQFKFKSAFQTVSSICSHYRSPEHKRRIEEGLASLILPSEGENNNRLKEKTAENVSDHDHGWRITGHSFEADLSLIRRMRRWSGRQSLRPCVKASPWRSGEIDVKNSMPCKHMKKLNLIQYVYMIWEKNM